jgi:predicted GIY-YIG superfamily endonuclease
VNVSEGQLLLFAPARPLAARLGADFYRAAPERPGVYLMSAARDGVLYVGKAKNLRRRLASHGSAASDRLPRRMRRLFSRVERIDWDECADEAAAILRERELIRTLQPRFNKAGVRAPSLWFVGWRRWDGAIELALGEDLRDWPRVHGPFIFARPGFAALLRSCWLELHPGASAAQLPSELLAASAPTRWKFDWNDMLEQWLAQLEALLEGRESRLLPAPPITAPRTPQTFDEQWRARDAECISELLK